MGQFKDAFRLWILMASAVCGFQQVKEKPAAQPAVENRSLPTIYSNLQNSKALPRMSKTIRKFRSKISVAKNVARGAFEPLQDMFQSFERHILFAHFHSMQRCRRDSNFSRKSRIAQFPALFPQKLTKLFLQ